MSAYKIIVVNASAGDTATCNTLRECEAELKSAYFLGDWLAIVVNTANGRKTVCNFTSIETLATAMAQIENVTLFI